MKNFDFTKQEITSEWLTSILSKNGFLSKGKVSSVEQEVRFSDSAVVSTFYALNIKYSPVSLGVLPSNILMKLIKPKFHDIGEQEVIFYNAVVNTKNQLPLVTCYGTENIPKAKQCYLLIEDHTDTHYQIPWGIPPTLDQYRGAISALAKIHAYWWNNSRFGGPIFEPPECWGVKWVQKAETYFPQFIDFLGERISDKRKKIYDRIFEKLPDLLIAQFAPIERRTLIHGDAHFWNFLFPLDQEKSQCLLIDWQSWGVGVGANDLAYMITLNDYPEHRQRVEQSLLKFYLREMQKHGIFYDWDDFWLEYRVSAIWNLIVPIIQHSMFDVPPEDWGPNLENGFSAFEDLNCLEFL